MAVLTWLTVGVVRPGAVVAGGGHAGEGRLVGLVAYHADDAPVRHQRPRLRLVDEATVLYSGHDARGCAWGEAQEASARKRARQAHVDETSTA